MPNNFCTICGIYICPGLGHGPPTEYLKWYQEIRAVRRVDPHHTAHLTGVGYLNASAFIVAPRDAAQSYRIPGIPLQSYMPLYDSASGAWTFVFHAVCWEILRERLSCPPADTGHLASLLFYMLHCTTWNDRNCIRPGHNFGGAINFQNSSREPLRDMINKGYSYFASDPSRFVNIDGILHYLGPSHMAPKLPGKAFAYTESYSLDVFAKLPIEVIHLILIWLPSDDIQRLRLASISVSLVSRVNSLSQFFWKSRFSPDFEMGFALPIRLDDHRDWRSLYFTIKHALRSTEHFPRLRNRKRIWQIAGSNASLLCSHLRGICLHGAETSWPRFSSSLQHGSHNKRPRPKIITTEVMTRDDQLLHVGTRGIFTRCLHVPLKAQSISAVGVCTVAFNSRIFVSGLRMITNASTASGCSLGYITPTSEVLLQILPEQRFAGFEFATCDTGIVGVRVILGTASGEYMSRWVGDSGKGKHDVSFGVLNTECETAAFNLGGSFDAFKLVSIALVNTEVANLAHICKGSERPDLEGFEIQQVWTPHYPRAISLIPDISNIPYQVYNPILNIDFGGAKGSKLGKITRIAAHMEDITAAFVGFTFDYDGDIPILYGRQGRIEVSFVLNALEGERITAVTYEQASTSIGLWSLELKTNFRRNVTFIPDALAVERPGEPIPEQFLAPFEQVSSDTDVAYTKRTFEAPHGQIITGFTSILGVGSQVFQTFSLQCDEASSCTGSLLSNRSVNVDDASSAVDLCSSVGSYLIGGPSLGCKAYTYAPLNDIKRIRFSCGSASRPRKYNEISGLWFDYFDEQPSQIIGQWISEVDTISLDPVERIVEISICMSKLAFSFNEKFHQGRVVQISIRTSHRLKTVHSTEPLPVGEYIELRFRVNKLEKLAFFAWASNANFDHPRVLSSPARSSERIILWDPFGYYSMFPWMAAERALWEDVSAEGKPDRAVTIVGYRNPTYGVEYITGFEFIYKSGVRCQIGYTHGERTHEIQLGEYGTISHLEITLDRYGILDIILQGVDSRPRHDIELSISAGRLTETEISTPTMRQEFDLSTQKYREYTIDSDGSTTESGTSQELPNRTAQGLWGFNMGNGSLILGVIYTDSQ